VLPELYSYIRQDSTSNWVFQFILIFLVLFTIFNTILMSVMERGREFGVMLAVGTPPSRLRAQVMVESVYINVIGCVLGTVVGCLVAWHYSRTGINLSSMMGGGEFTISGVAIDPIMRPKLGATMVRNLAAFVFTATFLLSVYPAWKAAKQRIAEVLR
jgi:ABC-type lipoprotein release transport system permease subunit